MKGGRTGDFQAFLPEFDAEAQKMIATKGRTSISAWVVAVMTISVVVAAPDKPVARITGAQLIRDLAVAAKNSRQVSAALEKLGRGARTEAPITEAGAVDLLRSLGVDATTTHPDRYLSRQQADALVARVKSSLPPLSDAQGVAVGLRPVPASIDDCLADKNHGACVECCKALGGGASTCAKTCFEINKGSSSEPLP
jgi:hypothetical protein